MGGGGSVLRKKRGVWKRSKFGIGKELRGELTLDSLKSRDDA